MVGRITALEVVWHRALRPGYGWIFPCRDGVFNIGVGIAHSHNRRQTTAAERWRDVNLREVFAAFTRVLRTGARADGRRRTLQGELKGAPLRCTLEGARFSRPGLLVTGEAAGSTYSFTGEGIGKAMETGMLAAEALLAGRDGAARTTRQLRADYEARCARSSHASTSTRRANHVNVHPWLADLLIWRAQQEPAPAAAHERRARRRPSNPGNLLSFKGRRAPVLRVTA